MADWICVAVLITLPFIVVADGEYFVSNEEAGPDGANVPCSLATPNIIFGTESNTIDDDPGQYNLTENDWLWIGYVHKYVSFWYEGCANVANVNSTHQYEDMNKDPGECYSKCKTNVIGMQETTCHCMPRANDEHKFTRRCTTNCTRPGDVPCGNDVHVSLYRRVPYPNTSNQGDGKGFCRALQWKGNGDHFYSWEMCSSELVFMCATDASSDINSFVPDTSETTWSGATVLCSHLKKYPSMELYSGYPNLTVTTDRSYWTGVFRTYAIDKAADTTNTEPGWTPGFITNTNGKLVLQFEKRSTPKKGLCQKVPTDTMPHDDSKAKSMMAIFIAVPVALVVIAIIAIVIIIVCRRRKTRNKHKNAEPRTHANDNGPESSAVSSRPGEGKMSKLGQDGAHGDNEYDTTSAFPSVTNKETDNIYNKLDRSQTQNNGRGATGSQDLYDHVTDGKLNKAKGQQVMTEGLYNTASGIGDLDGVDRVNLNDDNVTYAQPVPRSLRK